MKHVAFGLILICCHAWAIETNGYQGYAGPNKFKEILEKFKTILKNGSESLRIPVLDPFIAEQMSIVINKEIINLDVLLKNVNVTGLSGYNANDADLNIIGLKINTNLSWPLLTANSGYAIKGKADVFDIYGTGDLNISVQDFAFDTELNFITDGKYLKMNGMKLKFSMTAFKFHITGLFDDEEFSKLVSAVMSDMTPILLNDDKVIDILKVFITEKLNAFLSTKTIGEMLKLLGFYYQSFFIL